MTRTLLIPIQHFDLLKQGSLPFFLFLVALMLRLFGLTWGLPSSRHLHSFHPDEVMVLSPVLRMNIFDGDLNPHFFNYGSLFLYIIYFARLLSEGIGFLDLSVRDFGVWVTQWGLLHLIGRFLSAFFGAATVALLFVWVKRTSGLIPALVAAILLTTYPLHLQHSHFATVDVPLTFFTTLTLYGIVFWGGLTGLLATAFVGGLASAIKYSVAPSLFLSILSTLSLADKRVALKQMGLAFGVFLLGFLVGCPYAVFAFNEFFRDFYWETFVHSRIGHGYIFQETGNGYLYHLTYNLPAAIGVGGCVALLLGLWALSKRAGRPAEDQLTLKVSIIFALLYFLPLGLAQVRFCRYLMPLLPLIALWSARAVEASSLGKGIGRRLNEVLLGLCVFSVLLSGWAVNSLFAGPDPRNEAADWVMRQVKENRSDLPITIAFHDVPWFYTPPITPFNGGSKTKEGFEAWTKEAPFPVRLVGFDWENIREAQPVLFIASDFEYHDPLRLRLPEAVRFYQIIESEASQIVEFRLTPSLLPLPIPFLWTFGGLPHDMKYVNPDIKVYWVNQNRFPESR
ncbi:MAG: glycosyltransferase family 39 protein [Armatimonadetes bacterium]|nr:glycosyltransferase family 39 protein [Armatimonadota bacterium]MDW8120996.1 glycosyltransferase family 39 protein [Armatimonadota bacterium]